jgi:7-cyano-7-deazaguanine reductase
MPDSLTHLGRKSILTEEQVRDPRGILETFDNPRPSRDYEIKFVFPEFTSVCPVTGQPDFATITVRYVPDRLCVEMKSLKLYFFAYRDKGIFYEGVVNTILDDLVAALEPRYMQVIGEFAVRGGTAGTVTAEHEGRKAARKASKSAGRRRGSRGSINGTNGRA